jgi:hypothetical protein
VYPSSLERKVLILTDTTAAVSSNLGIVTVFVGPTLEFAITKEELIFPSYKIIGQFEITTLPIPFSAGIRKIMQFNRFLCNLVLGLVTLWDLQLGNVDEVISPSFPTTLVFFRYRIISVS